MNFIVFTCECMQIHTCTHIFFYGFHSFECSHGEVTPLVEQIAPRTCSCFNQKLILSFRSPTAKWLQNKHTSIDSQMMVGENYRHRNTERKTIDIYIRRVSYSFRLPNQLTLFWLACVYTRRHLSNVQRSRTQPRTLWLVDNLLLT